MIAENRSVDDSQKARLRPISSSEVDGGIGIEAEAGGGWGPKDF